MTAIPRRRHFLQRLRQLGHQQEEQEQRPESDQDSPPDEPSAPSCPAHKPTPVEASGGVSQSESQPTHHPHHMPQQNQEQPPRFSSDIALEARASSDERGLHDPLDEQKEPVDVGAAEVDSGESRASSNEEGRAQPPVIKSYREISRESGFADLFSGGRGHRDDRGFLKRTCQSIIKFCKFIGPGFIVAVSYIDPGNYATAVSAGSQTQYRLLVMTLLSNVIAIFLQTLCLKLGTVTGLNLAENCRAHLPRWLNRCLWALSELAIIATDISEVVGSVVAWNLLCNIPLVAGCFITLADVFVTILFYRPNGSMTVLRVFEYFVMGLVMGVVICFCYQLALIDNSSVGKVFQGYLPSKYIFQGDGLYLACGILGATVMPHSLFLGSGIVQSRLKEFDVKHQIVDKTVDFGSVGGEEVKYRPSMPAIRSCLKYSIIELALCLLLFALFVNSAVLIVSGASLFGNGDQGDLFAIYGLMREQISKGAATVFAVALLLSGLSAGIVATISGQFVSEGMLKWKMKPWIRRAATRCISVVPSVIIAAAVGKKGMNTTLTACQVCLSVMIPFVSAPLIYFTSRSKYMTVKMSPHGLRDSDSIERDGCVLVNMKSNIVVSCVAWFLWLTVVVMNVGMIVLVGMGKST